MTPTGFKVQFPTTPSALPPVRMAGAPQGWSPARRAQPMMAQHLQRPVRATMSGKQVGQSEAALWARGSDIAFSILTGLAAIVSGLGLIIEFGKGEGAPRRGVVRAPQAPGGGPAAVAVTTGRPPRPIWYVIGGTVALLGVANIWSSINRAAALQPTTPVATAPNTAQTTP